MHAAFRWQAARLRAVAAVGATWPGGLWLPLPPLSPGAVLVPLHADPFPLCVCLFLRVCVFVCVCVCVCV